MYYFKYIITSINNSNKSNIIKNIVEHARKNKVQIIEVDIKRGGQFFIYIDRMYLECEWRGAYLRRDYYILEAALYDGIAFSKGGCPRKENK